MTPLAPPCSAPTGLAGSRQSRYRADMIPFYRRVPRAARPAPRSLSRATAWSLAAFAASSFSLASCTPGAGRAGFAMPPVPVEVSDVHPQIVREQFRALGSIDAYESVQIVSE